LPPLEGQLTRSYGEEASIPVGSETIVAAFGETMVVVNVVAFGEAMVVVIVAMGENAVSVNVRVGASVNILLLFTLLCMLLCALLRALMLWILLTGELTVVELPQ
jgi:hypothetical protein